MLLNGLRIHVFAPGPSKPRIIALPKLSRQTQRAGSPRRIIEQPPLYPACTGNKAYLRRPETSRGLLKRHSRVASPSKCPGTHLSSGQQCRVGRGVLSWTACGTCAGGVEVSSRRTQHNRSLVHLRVETLKELARRHSSGADTSSRALL